MPTPPCRGYPVDNARGVELLNFINSNNLAVLNNSNSPPTFETSNSKGWPDLTIATDGLITTIHDWQVLDEVTISDHKYISYSLQYDTTVYHRHRLVTKFGNHKSFKEEVIQKTKRYTGRIRKIRTPLCFDNLTREIITILSKTINLNPNL